MAFVSEAIKYLTGICVLAYVPRAASGPLYVVVDSV